MDLATASQVELSGICAGLCSLHLVGAFARRREHLWAALPLGAAALLVAVSALAPTVESWSMTLVAMSVPPLAARAAWAALGRAMDASRHSWTVVLVVLPALALVSPLGLSGEAALQAAIALTGVLIGIDARGTLVVGWSAWLIAALAGRELGIITAWFDGPSLGVATSIPLLMVVSTLLLLRSEPRRVSPQPIVRELEDVEGDASRYKRMVRLGSGGMGELWLALRSAEQGFRRWVVLKSIRVDRCDDQLINRFLTEARISASLHHPNIVSAFDLGRTKDGWFLVMEYVPGPSLWEVLTRCRATETWVPVEIVAEIGAQICRGLARAHSHGVLHRDVSPDNVVVTFEGVAKLVDFGIAKDACSKSTGPTLVTALGRVVGKAQYLAPERIVGGDATPATDLFAVGLVLIQLLGVSLPERGAELAYRQRPIPHLGPALPSAFERVIGKALAPDPWSRYRSATEMADDLGELRTADASIDVGQWLQSLFPGRLEAQRELERLSDTTVEAVAAVVAKTAAVGPALGVLSFPQPSSSSDDFSSRPTGAESWPSDSGTGLPTPIFGVARPRLRPRYDGPSRG